MVTKKIQMNVSTQNNAVALSNTGETGSRFLEVSFIDSESNPFDLSDKRVILYAEKPDKMIVFNECTVIGDPSNGKILVEITSQMACSTGIVNCEFHVIKNNSVILKVTDLKIISNECLFNEQQIVSSNEYTALLEALRRSDEALETAQELIDSYDSRLPVSQKGTWTPRLVKHFRETTLPNYSFNLSEAFYYRIGKICYIFVNLTVDITSCQGETICIGGLPYVSASDILIQHVIPGLNCGFVPSPSGEGRILPNQNCFSVIKTSAMEYSSYSVGVGILDFAGWYIINSCYY